MNCRSRKVLAIAYCYPPLGGAGALRLVKFVQHLPRFGWEMVVLAPKDAPSGARWNGEVPRGEVIYTKYMDIFGPLRKRAGHLAIPREHLGPVRRHSLTTFLAWSLNEFVAVPDSRVGWYPYALHEGVRRVQKGDIAVIYSSSPPETTHLVAKAIHRHTGIPWVAELRDLWTQNPFYCRSFLRLWVEQWLECRTLMEANAIISVTEGFCTQLRDIVKVPIFLVRNGFDLDDFTSVSPVRFSKFTIVFMGTLYYPHEDPSQFLRALESLIEKGKISKDSIEVRFYGTDRGPWGKFIESSPLSYVISFHKRVPYKESIAIQKGCGAILLFAHNDSGRIPVKLYEAIGSGRPILAISPDRQGEAVEILRSLGVKVVSEQREIEEELLRLYRDYVRTGGNPSAVRPEGQILQFTRQEAARKLAEVFDRVSSAASRGLFKVWGTFKRA